MSKLFKTTTINTLTLANRFVRSATGEFMANEDGSVSPKLIDLMVQLAQGGVGLIITGAAYIRKDGNSFPWQLGNDSDDLQTGLSEMAEAVHNAGGKIVMQICHARALTGEAMGPSQMPAQEGKFGTAPGCRAMTQDDIDAVVDAFGQAATRAKQAGFDGVQLHGSHGTLLSEFLSPFFNKRTDDYGGSIDNRVRIVLEAYERVRGVVGDQFPVMIKINSEDFLDGGLNVEDMLQAAAMFEQAGIDAIELSGGTAWAFYMGNVNASFMRMGKQEVYYREAAKRYKAKIGVPLMLVGGIRSFEVAEQLVEEGLADYIALCRPLIREPDLINRWKAGDTRNADCISDNACLGPAMEGKGIQCVHVQ